MTPNGQAQIPHSASHTVPHQSEQYTKYSHLPFGIKDSIHPFTSIHKHPHTDKQSDRHTHMPAHVHAHTLSLSQNLTSPTHIYYYISKKQTRGQMVLQTTWLERKRKHKQQQKTSPKRKKACMLVCMYISATQKTQLCATYDKRESVLVTIWMSIMCQWICSWVVLWNWAQFLGME